MPRGTIVPERQRQQVLRRLAAGFSYSGTAVATGVPRGTVGHIGRQAIVDGRLQPRPFGRPAAPAGTESS
jgi:hypothetical protein